MSIAFSCPKCATHFTLSDAAAGKKGRCKQCSHMMTVPAMAVPQPEVVASGMFRLGAMASPTSELGLRPISADFHPAPAGRSRLEDDEDEYGDGGSYEMAALNSAQVKVPRKQVPAVQRIYRKQVQSGLGALRKLSDFAYLLSWPFILLILFGAATGARNLAVMGAAGVTVLSLGRFAIDGFFIVAIHFRKNPIEGVLFFIPPLTFYYLYKRWGVIGPAAQRLLLPVGLIAGVILAFTFVPALSSGGTDANTPVGERIKQEFGVLKGDIEGELNRGVDALEKATEGVAAPAEE